MDKLNRILTEIDGSSLSSISEIESGHDLDQAQFKIEIKKRVQKFQEYFLESGESVIVQKANSIDFFLDFMALYFMEVTIIPVDPASTKLEIENLIEFTGASLLISENENRILKKQKRLDLIGIAIVLFTSGTTSLPKGVKISRVALLKKIEILDQYIGHENIENTLCFVSTFFGHGLICNSLFPIFKGKNFYISKKMSLELAMNFTDIIVDKNITFFSSVPGHWEFLLEFSEPPSSWKLKRVNCASAPLNQYKIKKIQNWLKGVPLYDVYGATEMLGWFADTCINEESAESEFKKFWNVETRISSDKELCVKAPYMFSGYFSNNQDTFEEFFNTGDIFTDNKICGRTKNTINKAGIKIQIEDVVHDFMASGLLKDAGAFPIEDKFSGQQIGLFVVLKKGVELQELSNYATQNINQLRHPSEIISLASLPLNSRGKSSSGQLVNVYKDLKVIDEKILSIFNNIFKSNYTTINIERSSVLNWDSMRHAELIITLQKSLGIRFSVKDISNVSNLNSVAEQVRNLITEKDKV